MSDSALDARRDERAVWVFAALAYIPLFLTAPGMVAADTKAYLYLDPGKLLSRAAFLWEPDLALGTITHQNIGYLFPLGPYYWLMDVAGIPDWVAQRLLLGSILLAAGWGAMWLVRQLHVTGASPAVAGFVYLLSPYVLPYFGRTSALLLPWAALPWLIGLTARSLRLGGWRSPALFAIVLTLVGGTNASSLVFIGIGPALWVPFAVWVFGEIKPADAARTIGRLAALTIPTQLWWIAGLRLQGAYGLPILELTESVDTVAQTSSAAEVARQLGYWYFYGRDGVSQWTYAARYYTQQLWLIVISFAIPGLAMLAAVVVRWRYRAYFVTLIVVGLVLGVGTHPYEDPSPLGAAVKSATEQSASALALRNSPRAVPLLALGVAVMLAAGMSALSTYARTRWPGRRQLVGVGAMILVIGLAFANAPALWRGKMLSPDLLYDEELPDYWNAAAAWLDAGDDGTRVLELPGSDFGAYRWGETQDPVTPGLIDRAWVGRELTAFGTPPSTDLIRALDRRIQEGIFEPQTVAPLARLMGVGDVLFRFDSQYERYRSPRPRQLWNHLADGVPGLSEPVAFGDPVPNVPDPQNPLVDELTLAANEYPDPAPLVVFQVDDQLPIVRATAGTPVLIDGDAEGLVDLAAAGMLDPERPLFLAASLDDDLRAELLSLEGPVVVTDTNRKRAQRWGTIRENNGYTEQIDEVPLSTDPEDARLVVFPDAPDGAQSVTVLQGGIASVRASSYGNIVAYASERRPVLAVDGDQRTSWQVGGFSDVIGERLRIDLERPITTDRITVQQLPGGNRFIATVGVVVNGEHLASVVLDDRSRSAPGQELVFGERTVDHVELVIEHSNIEGPIAFTEFSNVGFIEVGIEGLTADELVRVPTVLFGESAASLADRDVAIVLSRMRADAGEPFRDDPETVIRRLVELPAALDLAIAGLVRVEARSTGETIDEVTGRPGPEAGFSQARGGDFLPGDTAARPSSAIDGDQSTIWSPGFGAQVGRGFEVLVPEPTTVQRLDLSIVADEHHSIPTALRLVPDDAEPIEVSLPTIEPTEVGDRASLSIEVPSFEFETLRVEMAAVDERTTEEYFSGNPLALPVGLAELGIDGVRVGAMSAPDPGCRTDLVLVDDEPIAVRLTPLDDSSFELTGCDQLDLAAGDHTIRTVDSIAGGLAVDRLILTHEATETAPSSTLPAPDLSVERPHRLEYAIDVPAEADPFWLVVGQSLSDGWEADAAGSDLGAPTLINGFANGWYIDSDAAGSASITVRWTPQRLVWQALVVSGLALVATIGVAIAPRRIVPQPGEPALARLRTPFAGDPRPLPLVSSLGLGVGLGVVAGLIGGLVPGVIVGVTSVIAAVEPRGRWLLSVWPFAAFGVTAGWYVARQTRFDYPAGVEWPGAFEPAHLWILTAVLMLGADLVVDEVRARSR